MILIPHLKTYVYGGLGVGCCKFFSKTLSLTLSFVAIEIRNSSARSSSFYTILFQTERFKHFAGFFYTILFQF